MRNALLHHQHRAPRKEQLDLKQVLQQRCDSERVPKLRT